jgi:hypothetical protein
LHIKYIYLNYILLYFYKIKPFILYNKIYLYNLNRSKMIFGVDTLTLSFLGWTIAAVTAAGLVWWGSSKGIPVLGLSP